MANKKISAFTELTEAPATTDVVPVVDVSDTTGASTGTTKKVSLTNLSAGIVDISTSQLDAASLVTESEGISSNDNDTTLPTSAAVKDYVDTQILTKDNLDEIAEGTTNKHFTATDETKLDGIETSATADQTGAEIKTAYEAEADTNAFTDADHTKLDGIESNATADQTDAEIRTAVGNATDSNVFTDADHTKLDGLVSNVMHTGDVTGSTALTIASGAVQTDMIAGGAITQIKIANDSIGSGQIGANAVGASELADDAVDTAAIIDDAVTGAKLNAALNDLSNVNASPSNNQILKWNSTSSNWEADDEAAAASGTVTGVTGASPISATASSTTPEISITDASTSAKGAASFSSDNFAVSSGAVTIKSAGVDLTDEVTGSLPDGNIASAATWNAKLADVVSDTTPQLGGDLDVNSNKIITASGSNGDIVLNPDGTGNVGINKDSPTFALHVADNSNGLFLESTGNPVIRHSNGLIIEDSDGTNRVYFANGGAVGIGTSAPDQLLTLQESGDAQISLKNSSAGTTKAYIGTAGAIGSLGTDDLRIRSDGQNIGLGFNGSEQMRLTDDGYLLVGGTSVATCFNGNGSAKPFVFQGTDSGTTVTHANNLLCIVNDDDTTGNMSGVGFGWTDTDESPHYLSASINCVMGAAETGKYRSGDLAFLTSSLIEQAPSEKMRLDADGTLDLKSSKLKLNSSGGSADQVLKTDGSGNVSWAGGPAEIGIACSDETSALSTGEKATVMVPKGMTIKEVKASLTEAGSSSSVVVNIMYHASNPNSATTSLFATSNALTIASGAYKANISTFTDGSGSTQPTYTAAEDSFLVVEIPSSYTPDSAARGLKVWVLGEWS